jgi:hypothetical protein
MTALVVYESMYGATQAVAEAIAEGLTQAGPVSVVEVGVLAKSAKGRTITTELDILVVGAPTHAFGLSRANTRADAASDAPRGVVSFEVGMREWLSDLRVPLGGVRFAAFDTKVARPKLPGSAAKAADKLLRAKGCRCIADPQSFWVVGKSGGLVDGELEAARGWGEDLARQIVRR